MDIKTKIEICLKDCIENHQKSEEEIFEIINIVLNKISKKKNINKKKNNSRRIVCRPALLISDSSDDTL